VLIDYVTGFANLIGSQGILENIAGGRALAQAALTFGVPLLVTVGPRADIRGGLYPEIAEVIDDHPIVYRGGSFDAFDFPGFEEAVVATGRRHLVIAGLTTDGCVLHTSRSALRLGYEVSLVVDASASETLVGHNTAVTFLGMLGALPRTWLSFAAELQRTYENEDTLAAFRQIQANSPGYGKFTSTMNNAKIVASSLKP
jgi:hypothetical protein